MTPFEQTLASFREAVAGPPHEVALTRAALLIGQAEQPGLDIDRYERALADISTTLRERLKAESGEPGTAGTGTRTDTRRATGPVHALNTLLFEELGFAGDQAHYTDPHNLLLHEVIDRRAGIPVTLAIIHVAVGHAAGVDLRIVGLPGHVVTSLPAPAPPAAPPADGPGTASPACFFDPFRRGAELTAEDCRRMVRSIYGRRSRFRDHFLEPITPRQTLQRVLHNLKAGALRDGDEERASRTIELLLTMFPWDLDEIRDRGMLRERLGQYPAALTDLQHYVRHRAGARDINTVAETVRTLRRHTGADAS